MTRKTTKRALGLSFVSLLLCITMLVGSTFAWFTDESSTMVNTIQAGKLDIELLDGNTDEANSLEGKTLTFKKADNAPANEAILFEPGAKYELEPVYLHNAGNLNAKYQVVISGIDGSSLLAKVLDVYVDDKNTGKTLYDLVVSGGVINSSTIDPGAYYTFGTIALKMQEDAGNIYQGLTMSGVAINVQATQAPVEYDSYNNTYDTDLKFETESLSDIAKTESGEENVSFGFDAKAPSEPVVINGAGIAMMDGYQDWWIADDVTIKGVTFNNGLRINVKSGSDPLTVIVEDCVIHALDQETIKNQVNFAYQSRDGLCFDIENSGGVEVNLIVRNCTLEGDSTPDMDRDGYTPGNASVRGKAGGKGIALGEISGSGKGITATIEGNTFNSIRSHAIQLYNGYTEATIKNNTFNSWGMNDQCQGWYDGCGLDKKTEYAIRGDRGSATLTIEDNTYNMDEGADKIGHVNVDGYDDDDNDQ